MFVIKYDLMNDKYVIRKMKERELGLFSIPHNHSLANDLLNKFNGKVIFHSKTATEIYFENKKEVEKALEWIESVELINKIGGN